jgi:hypothetical protein
MRTRLDDSSTKTIYLSEKWSGQTPTEMSILVHETSEKLDAFELTVLRFGRRPAIRHAVFRNSPEALPPVASGMWCLRSSGWSRMRMAARARILPNRRRADRPRHFSLGCRVLGFIAFVSLVSFGCFGLDQRRCCGSLIAESLTNFAHMP